MIVNDQVLVEDLFSINCMHRKEEVLLLTQTMPRGESLMLRCSPKRAILENCGTAMLRGLNEHKSECNLMINLGIYKNLPYDEIFAPFFFFSTVHPQRMMRSRIFV